ncbi:hypothetical protein D3C83_304270 [compost metagenome]
MNNRFYIRLVDTHSESYRGDHNLYFIPEEHILVAGPLLPVHSCMIRQRLDAFFTEIICQCFR